MKMREISRGLDKKLTDKNNQKDFQNWANPIKDYLKPTIDTNINRTGGMIWGAMVGSFFGSGKTSRIAGAFTGAAVVGVGKLYKHAYEHFTGEKWVPERRRKERDLTEYTDALKYVKNTRMFNYYADQSLENEGFDVREYLANKELEADERDDEVKDLNIEKSEIKELKDSYDLKMERKQKRREFIHNLTGLDFRLDKEDMANPYSEEIKEVNSEINEIKTFREIEEIPELALKALEYKDKADKTMFGYEQGDPLQNIISALPKKDRDAMRYLIKAPEEERQEILDITPSYLRRALQSSWGMKVDAKPTLESYFSEHQLPDADWEGWSPDVDLDAVKVKMINREGQDYSEHNVWQDGVEAANEMGPIALPSIDFRSNATKVKTILNDVLSGVGLKDINIDMAYSSSGLGIDLDLQRDNSEERQDKLKDILG